MEFPYLEELNETQYNKFKNENWCFKFLKIVKKIEKK